MEQRGPQVNYLSFADDIILFTSEWIKTLKLIMQTLKSYEEVWGQMVNKEKSQLRFSLMHSTSLEIELEEWLDSNRNRVLLLI